MLKIILCYAREDQVLKQELKKHLSPFVRSQQIKIWCDLHIEAGTDWDDTIKQELQSAHIILLLISSDFLDSDYCSRTEMQLALEQQKSGKVRVIPVILRACEWKIPSLKSLQVLPANGRPIKHKDWSTDDAFTNVAQEIKKIIEQPPEKQLKPDSKCPIANEDIRVLAIQGLGYQRWWL